MYYTSQEDLNGYLQTKNKPQKYKLYTKKLIKKNKENKFISYNMIYKNLWS